jgi:hypothetical protein
MCGRPCVPPRGSASECSGGSDHGDQGGREGPSDCAPPRGLASELTVRSLADSDREDEGVGVQGGPWTINPRSLVYTVMTCCTVQHITQE